MRKQLFILFILGLLAGCASSEADNEMYKVEESDAFEEEAVASEEMEPEGDYEALPEYEEEYEVNLVSELDKEINFDVFENRAIAMLKDYKDYVELVSDDSYEPALRKHAIDMVVEMFENSSAITDSLLLGTSKNLKVKKFFNQLDDISSKKTFELKDVEFKEPFKKEGEDEYLGLISFSITDLETGQSGSREIVVVLKKQNKIFGNNSKNVWKVLLSDLK